MEKDCSDIGKRRGFESDTRGSVEDRNGDDKRWKLQKKGEKLAETKDLS